MRFLPALLGLFAATSTLPAQTSVWQVTRGAHSLYLGGTCHLLRAEDLPLPGEFDVAYAASSKLFFESDIGRLQSEEMMEIIAVRGMFADGTTLDKVLTPAAWKAGDLVKLDELMLREMRTKYPAIFKSLLADRNKAWLPKLEELLKTSEVEFVLVGAGHMPGPEGLIAQLRSRGCTIEQIRAGNGTKARK